MKAFLVVILSFLIACNNLPNQGFPNKAEAKNQTVNGLKEGKWVGYINEKGDTTTDTSAPFYFICIYKAGKKNGIAKQYDKSGILLDEIPYLDDKINGVAKEYYTSGKLKSEATLTTGHLNGIWKTYYESGKLYSEASYNNGKVNGIAKFYYESGTLQEEAPYTDSTLNGIAKEYYENGTLKTQTSYTNGKKGATIEYDENGKPTYSVTIDSSLLK